MPIIEISGLSKTYQRGKLRAVDNLSLAVEKGTVFSLLGPNGAGKTTLIKILLSLTHATSGQASIFNLPVNDTNIHRRIGYLSENHRFPEFLNPLQVLTHFGAMSDLEPGHLKNKIPLVIEFVGLKGWEKVKIKKFSKGMRQRLGIAHALLNDPEILFLDEPTDGIDPVGRKEIRDLILKLKNDGCTIFMNSHLLSEVERISDIVVIMKNGKILRQGTVDQFTEVQNQYELQLQSNHLSPALDGLISSWNLQPQPGLNRWLLQTGGTDSLNRCIDDLRRADIRIEALVPKKISLEDYFIDVVGE